MTTVPSPIREEVRLGIVVVNYGSHALLEQHLVPLADATSAVVVVVDSYSSGEERDAIAAVADARAWALIAPDCNVGFGVGMNLGVGRALEAGCTHLLLLNPDVALSPTAVGRLLAASREHPRALITPRLERPDGSTWFAGGQIDLRRGLTRSAPDERQQGPERWLTGACLLMEHSTWEDLGGFDEGFFLYWEDVELSQRHLEGGGELRVVHDVTAVHDVGSTQGTKGKSTTYCREMCRNRLRFATLHLPSRDRLRWLWHSPRYAARVVTRDGRRAAVKHPGNVVAAAHGTVAGAVLVVRSMLADAIERRDGRVRAHPL